MKKLLKNVYDHIPLKREFFSLVKIFVTPGERVYKHLHFHGDIKVDVDKSHSK